ncbi:hypothetical protein GCM10027059_14010 [Myceligenerans halotolerans]
MRTTLVGHTSAAADQLRDGLVRAGLAADIVTLDAARFQFCASGAEVPEVLLISSALDADDVRALRDRLLASGATMPAFIAYPDCENLADHGSWVGGLAAHLSEGVDYIVPPFEPELLRRRFLAPTPPPAPGEDDFHLLAHLARYERELQIAQEIQSGFLPEVLPVCDGWTLQVRFRPARDVAGDFYDAYDLVNGRRLAFVVADVCDKGVGAALFMALVRSLLRHTATHLGTQSLMGLDARWEDPVGDEDLDHVLLTSAGVGPLVNAVVGTNEYMVRNHLSQGYFATLFFGVLDPVDGTVVFINCGHNPPVVRRRDGRLETLGLTGPALGMMPNSVFRLGRARLDPGDLLFLYTDGVTEARDASGAFYTEDRLHALIAERDYAEAQELVDAVTADLSDHVGEADQFDDITMMALRRSEDPSDPHAPRSCHPDLPGDHEHTGPEPLDETPARPESSP